MRRQEFMGAVEEFGRIFWPLKEKIKVEDIMIFGSLAYGKKDPNDIDGLLLHYNPLFDEFLDIAKKKDVLATEKLKFLDKLFEKQGGLTHLLRGTSVERLVLEGKFNLQYMNTKFFLDRDYQQDWIQKTKKPTKNPKKERLRIPGETFEESIFREGLLYNFETGKYDIPAKTKYRIPK